MSMDRAEWEWIKSEAREQSKAFADQLRALTEPDARVPGLDWSARELGAHVATLPHLYQWLPNQPQPFQRPGDWNRFSGERRAHASDLSLAELADLLVSDTEGLLEALGDDPDAPWTLYVPTTVGSVVTGLVTELILHGQDLGELTGTKVAFTDRHARAAIGPMLRLAPVFIDEAVARKTPGVFHIRFRHGANYTYIVNDGVVEISDGRPAKADARLLADAKAFVEVSMGRRNQWTPALTGKMVAYGKAPWKLLQLGKMKVAGV